jgi:hypothetical protein
MNSLEYLRLTKLAILRRKYDVERVVGSAMDVQNLSPGFFGNTVRSNGGLQHERIVVRLVRRLFHV